MTRGLISLVCVVGTLGTTFPLSCGGTETSPRDAGIVVPVADAGVDASDGGEASVEPSPEDPCADPSGTAARAPWPMVGGCARRPSSRKDLRGPASGVVSFTYPTTGRATAPVVAEDGSVIVATSDAHVVALTAAGQKRWDVTVAASVTASPVLTASGEVLFATTTGRIVKLALGDGAEVLARDGVTGPSGFLPLADGTVVYTASDAKLHRFDLSDLKEKATIDVQSVEPLTLARDGGILAAGKDGTLRRVALDGAVSDLFRSGGAPLVFAPIVTSYGDVVVVGQDGKLRSLDASGKLRFERPLGGAPRGTPAASFEGNVYVATESGKLMGFDREGKELFAFAPLGLPEAPVVTGSGTVFFGAEDTKLYAVQPTGRLLFSGSLRARALSSAAFAANGALYLAVEGGIVGISP
jgi:outer membrane protein assembly factor BamB